MSTLREKFGFRVNDRMWTFFQSLGVVDEDGKPTEHFGDPSWVYLQYCRRKSDVRSEQQIQAEATARISEVRSRGVFIAEGFGEQPSVLQPSLAQHIQHIYEDAKVSIWMSFDDAFVASLPDVKRLRTRSIDRADYILHPVSGEHLSDEAAASMARYRQEVKDEFNTQIVISDGLNALAVMDSGQLHALVTRLRTELAGTEYVLSPINLVVDSGRVRAGYRIGEQLFGGRDGKFTILHIIGERPGSGHHTLSIYMTRADGQTWAVADKVDHNITKVVSGIANTALTPDRGAIEAAQILRQTDLNRL
jgi:ethanolamine ammonia-lyase large subunit